MRVLLIGQKWFGARVMRLVAALGHDLVAAAPRGEARMASAAAMSCVPLIEHGARLDPLPQELGRFDLILTAHAHVFVPSEVRVRAEWAIGYHPSLLPLYRGKRSIEDTIADGQRVTGGTIYHLNDRMDAGDIAFQDWCFVDAGSTPAELWREHLAPMGFRLIARALAEFDRHGYVPRRPQSKPPHVAQRLGRNLL